MESTRYLFDGLARLISEAAIEPVSHKKLINKMGRDLDLAIEADKALIVTQAKEIKTLQAIIRHSDSAQARNRAYDNILSEFNAGRIDFVQACGQMVRAGSLIRAIKFATDNGIEGSLKERRAYAEGCARDCT